MDTNELIYKAGADSQTYKTNFCLPNGNGGAGWEEGGRN